jgi:hypothetical protein
VTDGVIDLVVTDLDGTLWHTDDALHPLVVDALAELGRRGVPWLVATGRRVGSTRRPLLAFGLAPPAVVLNGAIGLDLASGARFHRSVFPAADAAAVLRAFVSCGLSPCVYVDHPTIEVFVDDTPSTHPQHLAQLGAAAARGDLAAVVTSHPVVSFGIIGRPHLLLEPAAAAIDGLAETHLSRAIDLGEATLTVAPKSVSKWDGVMAYCAFAGLDPTRVLAIGDGPNDIELLSNAAVAVVTDDAHAAAAAVADHVVPAARLGGWASILDLF